MKSLAAALISGVLFALSLPPFNQGWLAWAALTPLLLASRGRRPLEAFGLGILTGAAGGAISVGWNRDTERLMWGWLPFLWLAMLFGTAAVASSKLPAGGRGVVWLACVGVAGEWVTTWTPLPLNIGLSQYQNLPLIQIASLTGIWGVSFLLWLANTALADAVLRRKLFTKPTIAATGAAVSVWVYGSVFYTTITEPAKPHLTVAAIQDFSGTETGDLAPAPPEDADVDYEKMTRQAVAKGAKLVVWSEERLGTGFDLPRRDPTFALARELHAFLVVGYQSRDFPKAFNCAALITPEGKVAGVHQKIHLYLGERQVTQTGGATRAFPSSLGSIGMLICFDSCYTGVTRQLAASGAQIVAMPNYDPPAPRGILHSLHSAFLTFRAVENHVPFVRADSNGVSQIVAADGRIVAQSPLFQPDILAGSVALGDGRGTFFTRWGDWLAFVCLVGALWLRPSRRVQSPS